ncbi:unnamed protein product [Protopolystoma xenopodis]|uniref:Uncharacterized protein n=1 Tax=Protopolystoma xenopodis TaxID=117903 RepID=A0A3S5CQF6_9PLAT|nr:unnamed protein product [Protopolystoma xenopodis]
MNAWVGDGVSWHVRRLAYFIEWLCTVLLCPYRSCDAITRAHLASLTFPLSHLFPPILPLWLLPQDTILLVLSCQSWLRGIVSSEGLGSSGSRFQDSRFPDSEAESSLLRVCYLSEGVTSASLSAIQVGLTCRQIEEPTSLILSGFALFLSFRSLPTRQPVVHVPVCGGYACALGILVQEP